MTKRNFYRTQCILFLLHVISETSAVNLISNKMASYCSTRIFSKKIFDGVKSRLSMEVFNEICQSKASIEINLGGRFSVNYVIVFEGYGNTHEQLDFFVVKRSSSKSWELCGEYPGKGNSKAVFGFRVNCKPIVKLFRDVTIISQKNGGFYISEIEIHSFGSGAVNEKLLIYRGCFTEFGKMVIELNLKSCLDKCLKDGFSFAGIKQTKNCSCDNNVDSSKEVPHSNCDTKCYGRKSDCIPGNFSVYLIKPQVPYYVGCFKSTEMGANGTVTVGLMTIAKCLRICEKYKYVLLQNGNTCTCVDDLMKPELVETSSCSSKCIGDSSAFCGGNSNLSSVYSTCYQEDQSDSMTCSELLNCNDSYDAFGSCQGKCKVGFVGEHCFEKANHHKSGEKEVASGLCHLSNPCLHIENSYCLVTADDVLCECVVGYSMNRERTECIDIDECLYEPCNSLTSVCINLNGSYVCKCKPGTVTSADDVCLTNRTKIFDRNVILDDLLKTAITLLLVIFVFTFIILLIWLGRLSRSLEALFGTPRSSLKLENNTEATLNSLSSGSSSI